jgi:hypothetical protein
LEVGDVNAIALLEKDHKTMKDLASDMEGITRRVPSKRAELFEKLRTELTAHETIETEIFYSVLKEHSKATDLFLEAYVGHHVADLIVHELASEPLDDEAWSAHAKLLSESIEHHIEEQEGELFGIARSILDKTELEDLGERMEQRKREVLARPSGLEGSRV